MKTVCALLACVGMLAVSPVGLTGQEVAPRAPSTAPAQPPPTQVVYRLQVVISHFDGEKKVSSLPFSAVGRTGTQLSINNGIQVPVTNSTANGNTTNFTYKNIGTNFTVTAQPLDDGRVMLNSLTLEESSVQPDRAAGAQFMATGIPSFPDFVITTSLIMRDGETIQLVSAANPLTGQLIKADFTLTILK